MGGVVSLSRFFIFLQLQGSFGTGVCFVGKTSRGCPDWLHRTAGVENRAEHYRGILAGAFRNPIVRRLPERRRNRFQAGPVCACPPESATRIQDCHRCFPIARPQAGEWLLVRRAQRTGTACAVLLNRAQPTGTACAGFLNRAQRAGTACALLGGLTGGKKP